MHSFELTIQLEGFLELGISLHKIKVKLKFQNQMLLKKEKQNGKNEVDQVDLNICLSRNSLRVMIINLT